MNRQNILKTAIMLAATLLIAACTNDEMADSQPETLPEGMYPLTFTATQADIVASPQTRVTDSDEGGVHKSKWTANDQIKVKVSEGGNDMETTCTLDDNGDITDYDPQLYWKTTQTSKINAWYSNIKEHNTTNSTVNLANQSDGLAYVLKADEMIVNYKSGNISLNFKHQLAKVRVKLEKGNYSGTLENITVKVKGYTSCTIVEGTIITTPQNKDYISTIKNGEYYEANLVPQESDVPPDFIQLNDTTYAVTTCAHVSNICKLEAGLVYTITLKVDQKTLDPQNELNNISGCVTIKGDNQPTSNPITITDNAEVTIQDVNITSIGNTAAITVNEGKHLKLIVSGTNNKLSSIEWGGIILKNDASIEIVGTGKENSSLTVTAGDNGSHEASTVGIGVVQNGVCGNISISNVNLTVSGANSYACGGAAIGTSSISSTCGNITIADAIINATSGKGAAAIGLGCTATEPEPNEILKVSDIKITSSEITVILNPYYSSTSGDGVGYGAGIGMSIIWYGNFECGTITIDKKESELEGFSRNWKLNDPIVTKHSYKIGKGYEHAETKPQDIKFGGVKLIDKDLSDGWGKWSVP